MDCEITCERISDLLASGSGQADKGMHYDGFHVLNPRSTDPSKIYRDNEGQIFRPCSPVINDVLARHSNEFLFDRVDGDKVYLRKAAFHVSVSSWCSAQVAEYLILSERIQNEMGAYDTHLSDGHPWNFVFHHSELKFVDFGSIREGKAQNDWYWSERAEYAPLRTFFFISYCGRLRRRLAENIHEPAPIPAAEILAVGFQGLSDRDCHTSFAERFTRLGGPSSSDRKGKWIGYREAAGRHEDLVAEDPRCATLTQVLRQDMSIRKIVDIGANDGLHSRLCARLGRDVLAFEIEDASASELYAQTKELKEHITVACTTLRDYVYHLKYIDVEFRPVIDFCILFAVFHHMVHDFEYSFSTFFEELESLQVRVVLMEFVDYDDVHLSKVPNRKHWYTLESLESFLVSHGANVKIFPQHELGRQLVLIENVGNIYDAMTKREGVTLPNAASIALASSGVGNDKVVAELEDVSRKLHIVKRYTLWRYMPSKVKRFAGWVLRRM